jgi:hypothetical protein
MLDNKSIPKMDKGELHMLPTPHQQPVLKYGTFFTLYATLTCPVLCCPHVLRNSVLGLLVCLTSTVLGLQADRQTKQDVLVRCVNDLARDLTVGFLGLLILAYTYVPPAQFSACQNRGRQARSLDVQNTATHGGGGGT